MPKLTIIEQAQYQRMPWKNGLGETLEIQRHEDESGLRFRISQASVVEDGVFSDFSGLHRTLVLLSGEGMTLEHKSETGSQINKLDNPLDIARFSGGDTTYATLKNGKIEDLNIMVRESDTLAKVEAIFAPITLVFPEENVLFIGFYAYEETLFSFKKDQHKDKRVLPTPSNSLISFKQHQALGLIELIRGSGVLITICSRTSEESIL